jgi:2-methylcitrate dehydratase PrpD
VEVRVDPALSGVQAVVEAETAGGKTVTARCTHARGSPENPLKRAEIEDKFRRYGKALLSQAVLEEAIGSVTRLEELKSVRRLMEILRTGGEKRARRSA